MSGTTGLHLHDEDEHLSVFKAVIAAINFEAIPGFASSIRQERDEKPGLLAVPDKRQANAERTACTVSPKPLFGSFNILYAIEFADGVRWLVKVPADGFRGRWKESDAQDITSEALTMQLVRRKTTIPVPEVFAFRATLENELHCPFILMEFIEGVPLHALWFDDSHPPSGIEQRRTRVLSEVASAITQLNQFQFHEGGSIVFDDDGSPGIGPIQFEDQQAMLNRLRNEDEEEAPILFEAGPFRCQKDYFLCKLDQRQVPPDKFSQGFHKLLRLFLSWIPYSDNAEQPSFVLAHPDYDIQNFIVSTEGELRGVIDWDGVTAIPTCLGNERYPSWLTRDWDPMMYGYSTPASSEAQHSPGDGDNELNRNSDEAQEATCESKAVGETFQDISSDTHGLLAVGEPDQVRLEDASGQEQATSQKAAATERIKENSPEELSRYRQIYQGFIAVLAEQAYGKASKETANKALSLGYAAQSVQRTRNSLMIDNLSIAAGNAMCQDGILVKIFEEIENVDKETYENVEEQEEDREEEEEVEESDGEEDVEDDEPADLHGQANPLDGNTMGSGGEGLGSLSADVGDKESEEEDIPAAPEDKDQNPEEFFDLGGFNLGDVALALADGELDEARLLRLKAGFAALCS